MSRSFLVIISTLVAILAVLAVCPDVDAEYAFDSNTVYDHSTGVVSFSGSLNADDVSVSVHANGYYSGETQFKSIDGKFSGEINVGKLARGMYRLIAMSVEDPTIFIEGKLRVDGYVELGTAKLEDGKILVAGYSSDRDVEISVKDLDNRNILSNAPIRIGEGCSFEASFVPEVEITTDLVAKASLISDPNVSDVKDVSVRKVTTTSGLELSTYVDESITVHLDVAYCKYSDLNVYSEGPGIASRPFA